MALKLKVSELSKGHPANRAANRMVAAHRNNETMVPALFEVKEEFPQLDDQVLIAMWLAVNASYQG